MADVRLIDANALGRYLSDWQMSLPGDNRVNWNDAAYDTLDDVLDVINNAPTIDPESLRPVGHWVNSEDFFGNPYVWTCTNCAESLVMEDWGKPQDSNYKFCPYCGAKMEGEK